MPGKADLEQSLNRLKAKKSAELDFSLLNICPKKWSMK